MIVPIDRPIIDAQNIAAAATQTATAGFVATHNQRAVLLLSAGFVGYTSNGTTPIQAGVRAGQLLTIVLVADNNSRYVKIQDAGNCALNGQWYVGEGAGVGAWLKVVWTGTVWQEIGRGNGDLTASGLVAYAEGYANMASGNQSHAEGYVCTASGDYAHAEGYVCTASGDNSHSQGAQALANQKCQFAHGGAQFASLGDAQYSMFVCRKAEIHSSNTWRTIGIHNTAIGPVIPADSAWTFEAQVVGAKQDCAKVVSFAVVGCLKRIANVTTLYGDPVSATVITNADDVSFECQATADDANDALSIQVRDSDGAGDLIRWVTTIKLTQITYT